MKTSATGSSSVLEIPVIRGRVLGVTVLRGYARICDLASVSKADIFDQKNNQAGTQRDLSPKHARKAYEYVKNRELAFWPEVFLCARTPEAVEYLPSEDDEDIGTLRIYLDVVAEDPERIAISRVDGNHRLHYADGSRKGFSPIERSVSFCLAYDLSLEQEITLFRDINDNQRRMNTSHLDNIQARLMPEELVKREEPELHIAKKLGRDEGSALYERVYEGGRRSAGQHVPMRTLKSGIKYMFSRPTKLTALGNADAQYKVINNYFHAVKRWHPQAWENPKKYLLLRGAGLWGICFIGSEVIDRVLTQGEFGIEDMLQILESGRDWDWSNKGPFQGLSGRGGAVKICDQVTAEFRDESGVSLKDVYEAIMAQE